MNISGLNSIDENSLQITAIVYETITPSQLGDLNEIPVSQTKPDFKSPAKMKVTGEITDENDITNFNGVLSQ